MSVAVFTGSRWSCDGPGCAVTLTGDVDGLQPVPWLRIDALAVHFHAPECLVEYTRRLVVTEHRVDGVVVTALGVVLRRELER